MTMSVTWNGCVAPVNFTPSFLHINTCQNGKLNIMIEKDSLVSKQTNIMH